MTVKTPVPVPVRPSGGDGSVRAPVAAEPVMLMLAVSEVGLLMVTKLTVMPEPENATTAPLTKFCR